MSFASESHFHYGDENELLLHENEFRANGNEFFALEMNSSHRISISIGPKVISVMEMSFVVQFPFPF